MFVASCCHSESFHTFLEFTFFTNEAWNDLPVPAEASGNLLGKTLLTPSRGLAETGVEHPLPYHGLSGGTPVHITQRSRGNDKIVVWL